MRVYLTENIHDIFLTDKFSPSQYSKTRPLTISLVMLISNFLLAQANNILIYIGMQALKSRS